jgi:ketosteroid isomerase-like protein
MDLANHAKSDSINVRHIKELYASLTNRDLPSARRLLVDEPVWDISPGSPDGGRYAGFDQIFGGFYRRLAARFRTFAVDPSKFVDGGDAVIAIGHYVLTDHEAGPEKRIRFAHAFGIARDGRITGVWQVADSALF